MSETKPQLGSSPAHNATSGTSRSQGCRCQTIPHSSSAKRTTLAWETPNQMFSESAVSTTRQQVTDRTEDHGNATACRLRHGLKGVHAIPCLVTVSRPGSRDGTGCVDVTVNGRSEPARATRRVSVRRWAAAQVRTATSEMRQTIANHGDRPGAYVRTAVAVPSKPANRPRPTIGANASYQGRGTRFMQLRLRAVELTPTPSSPNARPSPGIHRPLTPGVGCGQVMRRR